MIIIEIHYSSLNFKVPLPHKLVSWRSNIRTWPLPLRAFYRILTMVRTWQEPPGGGGADLWSQSEFLNLSFRVLRRKPYRCRYYTIMIVQWRIQTFRWGGGGGGGPSVSVSTRLLVSYPDLPLFSVRQSEIWVRDYPSFCCLPLFRLSYVGFSRPLCLSEFYPNTHGSMPVLSWDWHLSLEYM